MLPEQEEDEGQEGQCWRDAQAGLAGGVMKLAAGGHEHQQHGHGQDQADELAQQGPRVGVLHALQLHHLLLLLLGAQLGDPGQAGLRPPAGAQGGRAGWRPPV